MEVEKDYASKGVAGAGLGTGIAGLALGVYDMEHGTVDVDALYNAAKPYMGAEALPVKIPGIGLTLKLGKQDIDTLYAYIQEGIR